MLLYRRGQIMFIERRDTSTNTAPPSKSLVAATSSFLREERAPCCCTRTTATRQYISWYLAGPAMSVAMPPRGFSRFSVPPAGTASHVSKSAEATHATKASNASGSTCKCRAGWGARKSRKEPQNIHRKNQIRRRQRRVQ